MRFSDQVKTLDDASQLVQAIIKAGTGSTLVDAYILHEKIVGLHRAYVEHETRDFLDGISGEARVDSPWQAHG